MYKIETMQGIWEFARVELKAFKVDTGG